MNKFKVIKSGSYECRNKRNMYGYFSLSYLLRLNSKHPISNIVKIKQSKYEQSKICIDIVDINYDIKYTFMVDLEGIKFENLTKSEILEYTLSLLNLKVDSEYFVRYTVYLSEVDYNDCFFKYARVD